MKLTRFKAERVARPSKSAEALRRESSGTDLEFDPLRVVPTFIWDRIDTYPIRDRSLRSSAELPLLRLALVKPELKKMAVQDPELIAEIQVEISTNSRGILDPDAYMNTELGRYAELFPDVLQGLDEPLAPYPHDFNKSIESWSAHNYIVRDIALFAPQVKALLQLFPEKRSVIYEKIESFEFWDKGIEQATRISHLPGQVLDTLPAILADLVFIFPDKKADILEVVRPVWGKLQKRMVTWGHMLDADFDAQDPMDRPMSSSVTAYVDNILGMAELARLSHEQFSSSPQPLPTRLVA